MNIDVSLAAQRLRARQTETGTLADIHEQDLEYLTNCAQSGNQAAAQFGWHVIDCLKNGQGRCENDIHEEIYELIQHS
jgi:thymidylate kinase